MPDEIASQLENPTASLSSFEAPPPFDALSLSAAASSHAESSSELQNESSLHEYSFAAATTIDSVSDDISPSDNAPHDTTPNGDSVEESAGQVQNEQVENEVEAEEPSSFEEVFAPAAQRAESRYSEFDALFAQWRETGDPNLRDRLILMNRNLVAFIARKFLDRGEMSEDIMQQGLIGLINALDNFDPSRGTRFATFATPTIMGEIRRYLRDKTWTMRVPRRLQELHVVINHRVELLTQQLDRSPTYVEIARSLGVEIEEVIEALEMPHAMDPLSIDEALPNSRGDAGSTIGDQIGAEDADLEGWNDHAILQAALEKLPIRERQVLQLVYFQEHTQLEIARQLKISQMNVSRIQRRALAHLRELMNSNDI